MVHGNSKKGETELTKGVVQTTTKENPLKGGGFGRGDKEKLLDSKDTIVSKKDSDDNKN